MQKIVFTTILALLFPLASAAQGKRFFHYNCMGANAAAPTATGHQMRRLPALKTEWDSTRIYPVVVVLVEFANRSFSQDDPRDFYHRILNEEGYNEGRGPGCVADYFRKQSCGWFHPRFDIYGPVKSSSESTTTNEKNYGETIFHTATQQLFDSLKPDLAPYDWNGDGIAEPFIYIYAGYGGNETAEEATGSIWPNTSTFSPITVGSVLLKNYSASAELWTSNKSCGIGTICHEYSHTLGLPDFYPTSGEEYSVVDEWDLMDGGNYCDNGWCPPNYSAHEKMLLGWLKPEPLTNATSIEGLKPVADGGKAYIIATDDPNEYFILENRQWQGWDLRTPGHGLLVNHIDYKSNLWRNNTVNSDPYHHCYDYVHADNIDYNQWEDSVPKGTQYIGGHSLYLSTTPYPYVGPTGENRELTDASVPAATTFSPTPGGLLSKPITNIREEEGLVSFDFMGGDQSAISEVNHQQAKPQQAHDLTGRPIGPGYRGLAIKNGKKFLIQ